VENTVSDSFFQKKIKKIKNEKKIENRVLIERRKNDELTIFKIIPILDKKVVAVQFYKNFFLVCNLVTFRYMLEYFSLLIEGKARRNPP
jgi:hypothetical protein